MLPHLLNVGHLEVINRELQLVSETHVAVGSRMPGVRVARPYDFVNRINILQEGRDSLQAVSQFGGNRKQIHSAALLKISELRDLQSIEHHLPANTPRAQSRRLPV